MEFLTSILTGSMVQNYIKNYLMALVRHGVTAIGAVLLQAGVIDSDTNNALLGAAMVVASVAWSWWDKRGRAMLMAEVKYLMEKGAAAVLIAMAISAIFLAGAQPAAAADLTQIAVPVQSAAAPDMSILTRPVPCSMQSCSGWYLGFGLSGNGSNLNIAANGIDQSVFSAGGILDVHGGYQFWNGNYFFAVEGGVGNAFAKSQPVGSTVTLNTIVGYELVKVGGALSGMIAPSTSTTVSGQGPMSITVPASLEKILMSPYFVGGAMQRGGYTQWVSGAGAEFVLASAWSMDLRYLYAPSDGNLPSTSIVTVGLNRHFSAF